MMIILTSVPAPKLYREILGWCENKHILDPPAKNACKNIII